MAKRAAAVEYIYWDTCVIQSYFEKREGRWEILRALLGASLNGKEPLQLVTSTWTIGEVAYFEAVEGAYQLPSAHAAIREFWDSEAVSTIEYHEVLAAATRDIVRKSHFEGWTVKPKDAIHIASALERAITEFHTYDQGLAKILREHFGVNAGPPSTLRIRGARGRTAPEFEQPALDMWQESDEKHAAAARIGEIRRLGRNVRMLEDRRKRALKHSASGTRIMTSYR